MVRDPMAWLPLLLHWTRFCGLAIRRLLWQQLGGFDLRDRPAYCENTAMCLRARILHLEGLSHSRHTDQGLKQHQVRNLQLLNERRQHTLDTEQPPEGMPWLLVADGGLLGRLLSLLLQPSPQAETICQQRDTRVWRQPPSAIGAASAVRRLCFWRLAWAIGPPSKTGWPRSVPCGKPYPADCSPTLRSIAISGLAGRDRA